MKANGMPNYASSCNACRQCTPLGACLAFKGFEGAVPFLHGSQGCATYIRRYLISHFREPMDIASSSFSEESAIYGGEQNFRLGVANVIRQYNPKMIGVATTCLSETIGDDVPSFLRRLQREEAEGTLPKLVPVSTPSYTGSHIDGFHDTVRAVVSHCAELRPMHESLAVFPGMVSPEDIRYLRRLFRDWGLKAVIAPDYSETMDGGAWESYQRISPGGCTQEDLAAMGGSLAALDFSSLVKDSSLAGAWLAEQFGTERIKLPLPIGVNGTDRLMDALEEISGLPIAAELDAERSRLVDAMVDGHKYVSGVRVAVYGEADLALALGAFCREIGMQVSLLGTGGKTPGLEAEVEARCGEGVQVLNGCDFREIEAAVEANPPDLLFGHSKGYTMARRLKLPLVRAGFPVHDRFGGQRMLHLGYRGALRMYDELVNMILHNRQASSDVGWTYL